MITTKARAASISVLINTFLVLLKLVAGAITGSIAIVTEAFHSSVDLLAAVIALISVRKADEPADAQHPYGHEKVENVAAGLEGMLILVGAGLIIFEAIRRLADGSAIDSMPLGFSAMCVSTVATAGLGIFLRGQARLHHSPALAGDAAHMRADTVTSVGVLVGLGLVNLTGENSWDAIAALVVAVFIVYSGARIILRSGRELVDEAPPEEDLDAIEAAIATARGPQVLGYHKLRARRAGARCHIDLHVQFISGISLEQAHHQAHHLRAEIERVIPNSEVLIHLEPESSAGAPDDDPLRHG